MAEKRKETAPVRRRRTPQASRVSTPVQAAEQSAPAKALTVNETNEIQNAADSTLRTKKRTPEPVPVRPVPTPDEIQNAEDSELRAKKRARQRTLRGQ